MNQSTYYQEHLEKYQTEVKRLGKHMATLSILRLLVFILSGFGVYVFIDAWQIALFIGAIGVAGFLFLLSKYTDIKKQRAFNKELVEINKDELKIGAGDFHQRESGLHASPARPASQRVVQTLHLPVDDRHQSAQKRSPASFWVGQMFDIVLPTIVATWSRHK